MENLLITNHALMSKAQNDLAQKLWYIASQLKSVRNKTDDEFSLIMEELSTALWGIWSNYRDINDHVRLLSNVTMFMRPEIKGDTFNFIAWSALQQLKSLTIKYEKSFRRNYVNDLRAIDWELGNLEAWHIRLVAKVEEVTVETRCMLAMVNEDILANKVQKAAIADTPL